MSADNLRQYLHSWRIGERDIETSETLFQTNTNINEISKVITTNTNNNYSSQINIINRSRSFRPHCIIPQLYLGGIKDIKDVFKLHQKILPERMLLIISTCDPKEPARLEMRQLILTPQSNNNNKIINDNNNNNNNRGNVKRSSYRIIRLSVCSWEELEERVGGGNCSNEEINNLYVRIQQWLEDSLERKSFDNNNNNNNNNINDENNNINDENNNNNNNNSENAISKNKNRGILYLRLCLPWRDEVSFPAYKHFHIATTLMLVIINKMKKSVICHCIAGISRSVTLVCAMLLRGWSEACVKYKTILNNNNINNNNNITSSIFSLDAMEAVKIVIEFIREVRICASPNEGFMQQLKEYASHLFNSHTTYIYR